MQMEKFFFMKPFLELIGEGQIFKKIYAWILRIAAALIAIAGLFIWIFGWKSLVFDVFAIGFPMALGGILIELMLIPFFYMIVHTLWLRADTIEALPDSDYTVIPIMSTSLRLTGELHAIFFLFLGIAGGLYLWITGSGMPDLFGAYMRTPFLPSFGLGGPLLGGLLAMITGGIFAFSSLVFFYFLSEIIMVLVDIARNTRKK
jgi:hypothetical protein